MSRDKFKKISAKDLFKLTAEDFRETRLSGKKYQVMPWEWLDTKGGGADRDDVDVRPSEMKGIDELFSPGEEFEITEKDRYIGKIKIQSKRTGVFRSTMKSARTLDFVIVVEVLPSGKIIECKVSELEAREIETQEQLQEIKNQVIQEVIRTAGPPLDEEFYEKYKFVNGKPIPITA